MTMRNAQCTMQNGNGKKGGVNSYIPKPAPIFATTGTCRRAFGLSGFMLATLRKKGTVYAKKYTEKCYLYRVADIVKWFETTDDGIVRDKEYAEDLAWIEEQLREEDGE